VNTSEFIKEKPEKYSSGKWTPYWNHFPYGFLSLQVVKEEDNGNAKCVLKK